VFAAAVVTSMRTVAMISMSLARSILGRRRRSRRLVRA
jgi:hypothetical protein